MAWARTVAVVVPSPASSAGLGGHFAQHLSAHVLELILELDLLGDRHTVLGDARGAERLLEHNVAALGPQRDLDRIGQDVDAAKHFFARVLGKFYIFRRHVLFNSFKPCRSSHAANAAAARAVKWNFGWR